MSTGDVISPWKPRPVTSFIIILNVTIFMLQVIMKTDWTYQMSNRVYLTAYGHELYRYITHGFQHLTFFHLLFNMIFYYFMGNPLESTFGTLPMLGISIIFTIFQGILYTYSYFTMYLISQFDPAWLEVAVAGYSDSIFAFLWLYFVAFGVRELSFCGVFSIPARIYPFVLLLFSSLNSGVSFVAHLSGIVTGVLYHYGFFNYITIPRSFLLSFEENGIGRWMANTIPMYEKVPSLMNEHIELEQYNWTKKRYNPRLSLRQNCASTVFGSAINCLPTCCCNSCCGNDTNMNALGGPATTSRARQALEDARARAGQQFGRTRQQDQIQPPQSSSVHFDPITANTTNIPNRSYNVKQHNGYDLFEDHEDVDVDIELGLLGDHSNQVNQSSNHSNTSQHSISNHSSNNSNKNHNKTITTAQIHEIDPLPSATSLSILTLSETSRTNSVQSIESTTGSTSNDIKPFDRSQQQHY